MLVVTKISCAIYNFLIILLVTILGEAQSSGQLLILIGAINLGSIFARLGSDTYWISAGERNITIVQNELCYHLVLTILTAALLTIFVIADNFDITKYFMIFFSVFTQFVLSMLARIMQLNGEHVQSLSAQLLGGNAIAIPIFLLFNIEPLLCVFLSHFCILILLLFFARSKLEYYTVVAEPFSHRLHHFPQLLIGGINQNIVAIFGWVLGLASFVATTLTLQRLFGIVLWPVSIEMQRVLPRIGELVQTEKPIVPFIRNIQRRLLKTVILLGGIIIFLIWIGNHFIGFLGELSFYSVIFLGVSMTISSHYSMYNAVLSLLSGGGILIGIICLSLILSGMTLMFGENGNSLILVLGSFLVSSSLAAFLVVTRYKCIGE